MEDELRTNLLTCASAFAAAEGIKLSTLGKRVGQDAGYFERIADETRGFTTSTYGRTMRWLSVEWPVDLPWPKGVQRPQQGAAA